MVIDQVEILDLTESEGSVRSATERYQALSDNGRDPFIVEWTAVKAPAGFQKLGCGVAFVQRRTNGEDWKPQRSQQEIIACGGGHYAWHDEAHLTGLLLIIILPLGFVFVESIGASKRPMMAKLFNERMVLCLSLTRTDTRVDWIMAPSDALAIKEAVFRVNRTGIQQDAQQLKERATANTISELINDVPAANIQAAHPDWDVFISHASEDKDTIARPLARLLSQQGLKVWYDEYTLTIGDSLRRSIDRGLANSRYGVVILSPHFFHNEWSQKELDGLIAREDGFERRVLPVWHNIDRQDVLAFSPTLADRLGVSTAKGLDHVVFELMRVCQSRSGTITTSSEPDGRLPVILPAGPQLAELRSGKVLIGLHGIRTHAAWNRKLFEVATLDHWQVRTDRWNFGYFSVIKFLSPWSRSGKVDWFRATYWDETNDRTVLLGESQFPSIVAHSFGTFILGNALLKYDWLRFDRVILVGSILPVDFPWGQIIDRGQVQAVRNEFGVQDMWSGIVDWFVAGAGPSGRSGFRCEHDRVEQEQFQYTHNAYFDKGHMTAKWLPFLDRPAISHVAPTELKVQPPRSRRPWGLIASYVVCVSVLVLAAMSGLNSLARGKGGTQDTNVTSSDFVTAFEPEVLLLSRYDLGKQEKGHRAAIKVLRVSEEYMTRTLGYERVKDYCSELPELEFLEIHDDKRKFFATVPLRSIRDQYGQPEIYDVAKSVREKSKSGWLVTLTVKETSNERETSSLMDRAGLNLATVVDQEGVAVGIAKRNEQGKVAVMRFRVFAPR